MRQVICKILQIASDLDKAGYHEQADEITNTANKLIPNYGKIALDRLFSVYGDDYKFIQAMSDNSENDIKEAIEDFLSDLRDFDSPAFKWISGDFNMFKLMLRWLKRLGAAVPEFHSHDCDHYRLEDTLNDSKYLNGIIEMFRSQPPKRLYEMLPKEYV